MQSLLHVFFGLSYIDLIQQICNLEMTLDCLPGSSFSYFYILAIILKEVDITITI